MRSRTTSVLSFLKEMVETRQTFKKYRTNEKLITVPIEALQIEWLRWSGCRKMEPTELVELLDDIGLLNMEIPLTGKNKMFAEPSPLTVEGAQIIFCKYKDLEEYLK